MKLVCDIIAEPPIFENELGVKWWHDDNTNSYAKSKGLTDLHCVIIQESDGTICRGIIQNQELIYTSQLLEAIACHLDMILVDRMYRENGQ